MTFLIEAAGYAGALAVLGAYAMVTRSGPSLLVHALNFVGAAAILGNAAFHGAFPSVALNAAWLGIAVVGMRRSRLPAAADPKPATPGYPPPGE